MISKLSNRVLRAGLITLGIGVFMLAPGIAAQDKSERKVLKRVEATYPPIAVRLHLAGAVKLVLHVSPEGKVSSVHTVGGNPILAAAAEGATKQWKYEVAAKESSEAVTIMFAAPE